MPHFRTNTWDANIWNDIVDNNEYGVHNSWPYNVIDIGGHIGSFSFKMITKQDAKKVIVVEPNIDNYNLLIKNLEPYISNNIVIPFNLGIGPPNSKINIPNNSLGENTGGSFYSPCESGIDTISLDDLIELCDNNLPILLKLDCEGCEYEALASCTKLDRINCIVGEFHNRSNQNIDTIKKMLIDQYHFSYHYRSDALGLFGAHKR